MGYRVTLRHCVLATFLVAIAIPSAAQTQVTGEVSDPHMGTTQASYGSSQTVELCDITSRGRSLEKKNVRTTGRFDMFEPNRYWVLRGECEPVLIIAMPYMASSSDLNTLMGKEVELGGIVREIPYQQGSNPGCGLDSQCNDPQLPPLPSKQDNFSLPNYSITMFSISDISPLDRKKREESQRFTLEHLVKNPGSKDGATVRVVGKFRGHNLYGDLPAKSQRRSSDWVIKDDLFAVWITGKKPKGGGFDLDAGLKRDTNKWIEVVGRPKTLNGVTYIEAQQLLLTTAPTATAEAQPPPPLPERPKVAPVVVFALPLDGEREVAPDARFVVQFSKDMDESTFEGRVRLRYIGPIQPGDRPFDAVKLTYDGGRRALTVDPGDVLKPGRRIELLLLPGIADIDGLTLLPRPDHVAGFGAVEAVDILRYLVAS